MANAKKENFKTNNIFSIEDFRKDISKLYGLEILDSDNNIIPLIDLLSIITHFIHLENNNKITLPYSLTAQKILNIWNNSTSQKQDETEVDCLNDSNVAIQPFLFPELFKIPFPAHENTKFNFIDLFSGIGGFRLALQECGGLCVFSSEIDENARKTYFHNFGEVPFGDITSEFVKSCIPNKIDIICAGFPCQAFSIAGYQKGFNDTRGTLFFDVAEIIKRKRPKAVYLENVKNLCSHDNGNTFKVIKTTLENLGYVVYYKVMNAMEYANIPQNRERIFIVCFEPNLVPNHSDFKFPEKEPLTRNIKNCINYDLDDKTLFYGDSMSHINELRDNINSFDTIYQWRRKYVRENKSNVCPTLTANMGTGGHNVPLILTKKGIRKLSPKECLNFQGFPSDYNFPSTISNAAKYKQAGNSVVVPLITKVCKQIVSVLLKNS